MKTTNDAMYEALVALYPDAGKTLGDLLYTHWSVTGLAFRGTAERDYYSAAGTPGFTLGDLANNFWSDPDYAVSNLELEDGNDLLLEDGTSFALMEIGNG
jgi:hypothetical protein